MASGGLGAGKLGNTGLDLAGDFDLAPRSGARLACKGCERANFATTESQTFEVADGNPGVRLNVGVFQGRAMWAFVG